MALAVVDQFVPEYAGTLVWSLHNQLALATPKIIHLFVKTHTVPAAFTPQLPFIDTSGRVAFKRGHIAYEALLGDRGEGKAWSNTDETLDRSISWHARRRVNKGFRMICWWTCSDNSGL